MDDMKCVFVALRWPWPAQTILKGRWFAFVMQSKHKRQIDRLENVHQDESCYQFKCSWSWNSWKVPVQGYGPVRALWDVLALVSLILRVIGNWYWRACWRVTACASLVGVVKYCECFCPTILQLACLLGSIDELQIGCHFHVVLPGLFVQVTLASFTCDPLTRPWTKTRNIRNLRPKKWRRSPTMIFLRENASNAIRNSIRKMRRPRVRQHFVFSQGHAF